MEMEEDRNERMCPGYNLVGLKVEGDKQVAVLKIEEKHLGEAEIKGKKVATGMFAFGVGNAAMGWEVNRFIPIGQKAIIGTANIIFKKPVKEGDTLKAKGEVVRQEGRKIFAEATVFNQKGEIVATLEGIFIVLSEYRGLLQSR